MSAFGSFAFFYFGGALVLALSFVVGTVQTAVALAVSVLLCAIVENAVFGWVQGVTTIGLLALGYLWVGVPSLSWVAVAGLEVSLASYAARLVLPAYEVELARDEETDLRKKPLLILVPLSFLTVAGAFADAPATRVNAVFYLHTWASTTLSLLFVILIFLLSVALTVNTYPCTDHYGVRLERFYRNGYGRRMARIVFMTLVLAISGVVILIV